MTTGSDHTNPRWLSAAFAALPILLSILYAVVASRPEKANDRQPNRTELVATRTP